MESQNAGHVGVARSRDEEDAEVPSANVLKETHEAQTDKANATVADDEGTADVVLVAKPCTAEHPDSCQDVRRSDEAFSGAGAETHAVFEDQRKEVGDGVGARRRQTEQGSEAPDLQLSAELDHPTCSETNLEI